MINFHILKVEVGLPAVPTSNSTTRLDTVLAQGMISTAQRRPKTAWFPWLDLIFEWSSTARFGARNNRSDMISTVKPLLIMLIQFAVILLLSETIYSMVPGHRYCCLYLVCFRFPGLNIIVFTVWNPTICHLVLNPDQWYSSFLQSVMLCFVFGCLLDKVHFDCLLPFMEGSHSATIFAQKISISHYMLFLIDLPENESVVMCYYMCFSSGTYIDVFKCKLNKTESTKSYLQL